MFYPQFKKVRLRAMRESLRTIQTIQVGDNTNRPLGLTQRSPRPLNGGDCSIEAKITAIIYIQIRNFDNRPLNTRWPLNAVSLSTSSTVFCFDLVPIIMFNANCILSRLFLPSLIAFARKTSSSFPQVVLPAFFSAILVGINRWLQWSYVQFCN